MVDPVSTSVQTFKGEGYTRRFQQGTEAIAGVRAHEANNIRTLTRQAERQGFEVVGVSTDDEQSHQKFISKYALPFTLISDTDRKIVTDYGVWVEKNMYGRKSMGTARKTFIIGTDGVIRKIIEKVDSKNSSQQVLDLLR